MIDDTVTLNYKGSKRNAIDFDEQITLRRMPLPQDQSGILNNRYTIKERLHTALSLVYHAEDSVSGLDVVVKTNAAVNKGGLIENERNLLRTLQHGNIPHLYETYTDHDSTFLVMEYIPHTLADFFGDAQTIDEISEKVFNYLEQTTQTLAYLEKAQIAHADIKPDNSLMAENGTLKLIDFGISTSEKEDPQHLSGTPFFMSPEVCVGKAHSPRSDIYALGISAGLILSNFVDGFRKQELLRVGNLNSSYNRLPLLGLLVRASDGAIAKDILTHMGQTYKPSINHLIELALEPNIEVRPGPQEFLHMLDMYRGN